MALIIVSRFRHTATVAVAALLCLAIPLLAPASLVLPINTDRHVQISGAVFRGAVVDAQAYEDPADGGIYTRTVVRVDEVFKGKVPSLVSLVHRGGTIGERGEASGLAPQLAAGEERLFFVSRRTDGTLSATRGFASALPLSAASAAASAEAAAGDTVLEELRTQTAGSVLEGSDVSDQSANPLNPSTPGSFDGPIALVTPNSAATNLIVGADHIPARYLAPDRGTSIPYLIDADYLPAGITQTQAVSAVQAALAAWTSATSVRYQFAGVQSFGKAAPTITNADGVLRIQLHDHYNYLSGATSSGDVLGDGGHAWTVMNLSAGWTTGGNVAGSDFHKVVRGYVVLQHTNPIMQSVSTLTEAICHEVGHTIGLAHSSDSSTETNQILKQAIMYYMAHADGRGATLNSFDTNVCRQIHPRANTPPYCYDRYLDIVTTTTRPLNVAGVNSAQVRGYDLQNTPLTLATTGATASSGTFSVSGSNITYVPKAFYADTTRLDPAGGSYYDVIYARYSDGTNASPYAMIRVISFAADSYNEGIPDSWRLSYFGSKNPATGTKHHAADDADGDGYTNLQEYLFGSNPTNRTSNLRITSMTPSAVQWQSKGYEVYELVGSTNFTTWTRACSPSVPTNSAGIASYPTSGGAKQFFRIQRVP
jgi:hypothetical protein